jgi:exodeoxyribonuclease V alpha subunit
LSEATRENLAQITGIAAQDILPAGAARGPGLPDSSVWLSRNYRFGRDSSIGRLAALVVSGDAPATLQWLRQGPHAGLDWLTLDDEHAPSALLERAALEYAGYVHTVQQHEADPALVFAAFERFRVLCALRNTARGVQALNQALEARLKAMLPATLSPAPWYCGRPVIVTRNDYGLRLFNGDVGIALRDTEGRLRVLFADRELGYREVAINRLPEHEPAFAMTVHRAQGSEFDGVMVVMPEVETRVSTRELLYTAVTRARERLVLCGDAGVLAAAVAVGSQRGSGLGDRLRGQLL